MLHPDGSFFGEIVVLQLNHTRVEAVSSFHTNTFALPQLSPEVRVAEPPNGASQAGIKGSGASAAEILCTWRVKSPSDLSLVSTICGRNHPAGIHQHAPAPHLRRGAAAGIHFSDLNQICLA
jgi:hypothetical protein